MSWSISYLGKGDKVVEALEKHSESLSGNSKAEFDKALPHLVALVKQNFDVNGPKLLKVDANGHGSFSGGGETEVTQVDAYTKVSIEPMYTTLV